MNNIILLIALLSLSHSAFAYFDPATGSILLQGLLAGLAGLWLTWRLFMDKIKRFLGLKKEIASEAEHDKEKTSTNKSED